MSVNFENTFEVLQIISKQQQVQFLRDANDFFTDHPDDLRKITTGDLDPDLFVEELSDETLDKYFMSSTLLNILKSSVAKSLGLDGINEFLLDSPDED